MVAAEQQTVSVALSIRSQYEHVISPIFCLPFTGHVFRVDFSNPRNNFVVIPVRILGYKAKEKSLFKHTKITLYFPGIDARDFYTGLFSAKVVNGGKAIKVTMPTIPDFWLRFLNKINKTKLDKGDANKQDKEAHEMLITRMQTAAGDSLRTIDALYEFPEGTLVSNKMFNKGATDDSVLIPHIQGCGSKFKAITQSHFAVSFDMVVVGSEEQIRNRKDDEDDMTDMFAGMDFGEDDDEEDDGASAGSDAPPLGSGTGAGDFDNY
jgi:hypothetical protein